MPSPSYSLRVVLVAAGVLAGRTGLGQTEKRPAETQAATGTRAAAERSGVIASLDITDLGGDQFRVVFRFKAPADARTVHLAGTFNGWNPQGQPMTRPEEQGPFRTAVVLPKGRHEYKFVVNGSNWQGDPENPHKTQGYSNAILYLGVEPREETTDPAAATRPVEMAATVEHPAAVRELAKQIEEDGGARWFAEHPMPLFTKGSVSFVYADPDASQVTVLIAEQGRRSGYEMRRLIEGKPVWAVSLDRSKLPERMAYTFQVWIGDVEKSVVDPHAWSVTSRGGRPAAMAVEASDRRGRIEVIAGFKPSVAGLRERDIYVYLPPGYDGPERSRIADSSAPSTQNSELRYPVLYMHDGQNGWDDPVEPFGHGGWCVNLKADELIAAGKVRPFIVVGIANTPDRMSEYGSGKDVLSDADHAYIQFLKRDVKPRIDRTYRTLQDATNTALIGSSMGGVISFQAALLNPDIFGQAACLSPAFGFGEGTDRGYAELVRKVGKVSARLYLDSGTAGQWQDGAPQTRAMAALLREAGWKDGADLLHFEDTGADHNERAWRARLDRPLVFLFGR